MNLDTAKLIYGRHDAWAFFGFRVDAVLLPLAGCGIPQREVDSNITTTVPSAVRNESGEETQDDSALLAGAVSPESVQSDVEVKGFVKRSKTFGTIEYGFDCAFSWSVHILKAVYFD